MTDKDADIQAVLDGDPTPLDDGPRVPLPIPEAQLRTAWQLAKALGHTWAMTLTEADLASPLWTPKSIGKEVRERLATNPPTTLNGPFQPKVHKGSIVYRSVSERTKWVVNELGEAVVYITRPNASGKGEHVVFQATLSKEGLAVWNVRKHPYHVRHVNALRPVLVALTSEQEGNRRTASLMERALPD